MSAPHGASPATWAHWADALCLGPDLLPVVCSPDETISATSKLVGYGKVPSRFDANGHVVGFPKWTSYVARDEDLAHWSADPRLGICLQTRHVRALDVDIEDWDASQAVRERFDAWCVEQRVVMPVRSRPNSCKWLALFFLSGEHAKQVLHTPDGVIELLMNGQQAVVAGLHPSGAMYEWEGGLPTEIPVLTQAQFESLKATLKVGNEKDWTEGRVRKPREAGLVESIDDPVVRFLVEKTDRVVNRTPSRIDVRCPWAAEHTSGDDPSSTSVFPAGTAGYETTGFRCLHAHCIGKTISDFLSAIGWALDGFDDLTAGDAVVHAFIDGVPSVGDVANPLDTPPFERQPKTGKIKPILNNMLLFLHWLCAQGEGVRYDVFRDEIILSLKGGGERSFTDADYTRLQSRAETGLNGFAPLTHDAIRRAVHLVAQDRCIDSGQEWLTKQPPWDGVRRIDHFCSRYLGADPSEYATAVSRYLWSAMAGRILKPGVQADMSVILVSDQGTGKSSSVRAMAPMRDCYIDLSLSDRDADLARLTRGKTLVELSELRGLHTKEMDSIKAFVTRLESEWIPKFFEMRTVYLRRFIMIGTTNNEEFLGDATGERRWLPLRVGTQNVESIERDHAQLWAEGRSLYQTHGVLWKDAQMLGTAEHAQFSTYDAISSKLRRWLDGTDFKGCEKNSEREFLHMYDIMREGLGYDLKDLTRPNQMRVSDILRRLGYTSVQKWADGANQRVWVKKS